MTMLVSAAKREGRSHRTLGIPCQDAYAVHQDPQRRRTAAAVGDGLGSRPLSHLGSQAACDAAISCLAAETGPWDRDAVLRAVQAGHEAVLAAATARGLEPHELATTLQVAVLEGDHAIAAMVGDGAVVAGLAAGTAASAAESPAGAALLVAPATAGYANEVVPLTTPDWREYVQVAEREGANSLLLFTDGLTRLLLSRGKTGWSPFAPFFDAFLPTLDGTAVDERLVERFLAGSQVDQSWDDDKCLVVIRDGAHRV